MKHDNKPLTLEELKQMDRQPVFGVSAITGKPGEWFIVHIVEMSHSWYLACSGANQGFGDKDTYGKTWLAYAQKPIGFDEWTAEWKEYTGADAGFHYCSKCGQQAFNYEEDGEVIEVLSNFCPCCGKAMTEFARLLLEKRLSGHNNEQ